LNDGYLSFMLETCHRYVWIWQDNLHPYHCHELLYNFSRVIDSFITVITSECKLVSVLLAGNAYITGSSGMVGWLL
jgi:hypothetical protein